MRIPIMKPRLASIDEITPLLARIDQTGIYTNHGPLVCELEETYARFLKTDKELVVALANATQAIQGLLSISKKTDWVVPDYTFSATGLAVLNSHRNLHICDVNLFDWKIDSRLISKGGTSFGVIPVMPFGAAVNFHPYIDFDEVIIDAAASLGSDPPTFSEMKKNWAVVYSLHATKVLGAGEGAIVVCGNLKQAQFLRAWSNFGFSSNRTSEVCGTNAKMSEVNAAYGLYSIQNIEVERAEWLKSQEHVALQSNDYAWSTQVNSVPQFHPYWVASFKDEEEKIKVTKKLNMAGIEAREWWAKPLSMQNAFASSRLISENTNAKFLASVHLGLPMFKGLSAEMVEEIIKVVNTGIKS